MSGGISIARGFQNLDKVGVKSAIPELLTDEQLYAFSKERFNFYQQLMDELSNPNSVVADRVFGIANRNRYVVEKLRDDMNSLANAIAVLESRTKEKQNYGTGSETDPSLQELILQLNRQLDSNVFLKDLNFVPKPIKDTQTPGERSKVVGGAGLVEKLKKDFDTATTADALRRFRIRYENDPIMAPALDEITSADRVIFIAITFLFRGISLFLTEWAMNSYMFTGFQAAIGWYCILYLSLFLLLAFIVNASEEIQLFRMTFYYLSFNPHGYGRIGLHALVLLMLLPIPFLVKDKIPGTEDGDAAEDNSFAKRRSIMRVLSNLTFFIWVLTSAIALRY